jgi:hypothetical protein
MNLSLNPPLLFRLMAMLAVCLLIGGLVISAASAETSAPLYAVNWYTFDGGGGISNGGAYTVKGTIGQPDAGLFSGGVFDMIGGFWAWLEPYLTFMPLIKK